MKKRGWDIRKRKVGRGETGHPIKWVKQPSGQEGKVACETSKKIDKGRRINLVTGWAKWKIKSLSNSGITVIPPQGAAALRRKRWRAWEGG